MSPAVNAAHQRGLMNHWIALFVVVAVLAAFAAAPMVRVLQPVRAVKVAAALPDRDASAALVAVSDDAPRTRAVQAPGWLEPDPYFTAVTTLADGVVASVHALEGESVTEGQVVARLVDDDAKLALQRAEAELATARAALAAAQADHAAAETDWNEPVERDRQVASARAAHAEAQAELAQLPSMIAQADAEAKRWAQELEQVQRAFDGVAATDRELIIAKERVASSAASLESMKRRDPILKARVERLDAERIAAERAAELRVTERRALDAAAAQVGSARAAVARHEAAVAEAKLRLDRMVIRAPMDAVVMRRLVAPGDKVMLAMDSAHSAHIIHIYDPQKIQVRVDVPLADASQVRVGQACQVVVDVLPDTTFRGEVSRITYEADLQKNTLQVKVRVLDPSPLLRPEMLTRVKFLPTSGGGGGHGATTAPAEGMGRVRVPISCLDGERVWVVRDRRGLRGRVEAVAVQRIDEAEGYAVLEAPLRPGDLLIDQPAELAAGQRVQWQVEQGGDA